MARSEVSDAELMEAYVSGDPSALSALFERYAPMLLRMMRQGLYREEDARDLVQQTFLHVHKARNDFRRGASFRPWVVTIAYNLKREYMRRHKVRKEAILEEEPESAERGAAELLSASQDVAHLRKALSALPDAQREVIELHWFQGLSFREIAEMVGAKLSAVKVRAHRGYAALRADFSKRDAKSFTQGEKVSPS